MTRHSSMATLGTPHTSSSQQLHSPLQPLAPARRRLSSTGSTGSGFTTAATSARRRDYDPSAATSSTKRNSAGDWSVSVAERMRNITTSNSNNINSTSSATATQRRSTTPDVGKTTAPLQPQLRNLYNTYPIESDASPAIKPTLSRKTSAHSLLKNVHFSRDCVDHYQTSATTANDDSPTPSGQSYESPEQIIARLFPPQQQPSRIVRSGRTAGKSCCSGVIAGGGGSSGSVTKPTSQRLSAAAASATVPRRPRPPFVSSVVSSTVTSRAPRPRAVYRPDSLQELSRDFEAIKYDGRFSVVDIHQYFI